MKIPRLTVVTLGVDGLSRATRFYEDVLATRPNTSYEGVTFIELTGTWLALFPLANLAKDISPGIPATLSAFSFVGWAE